MRILVVSNMYPCKKFPSYGIFVKRFVDELDALNIEHKEVVIHKTTTPVGKVFAYIKFYAESFFKALFGKYDLIYVHYISHSSPGVLLASKFKKLKFIANPHGDDVVPVTSAQKKMVKYSGILMDKSYKVVSPSKHFADIITRDFGVDRRKIVIYPSCGVDDTLFSPISYKSLNSKPQFVMAGRLDRGKGWDIFLNAVKLMEKNGLKAEYLVIGSGKEEADFLSLRRELGLENIVKHKALLPQEELAGEFKNLDYFVFPTVLDESLGLTIIEAMSSGLVPVCSNVEVSSEYINFSNGFTFEKGDEVALFGVMKKAVKSYNNHEYFNLRTAAITTSKAYSRTSVRAILKELLNP